MATKKETIEQWETLQENMAILPHFEAIPYKSKGSSYGACGIRIDGNPAFIDAVLSRLKDLLDGENAITRLELARNPVDGSKLGKSFDKRADNAECCYIRLHQRGGDAQHVNMLFDKKLRAKTEKVAESKYDYWQRARNELCA